MATSSSAKRAALVSAALMAGVLVLFGLAAADAPPRTGAPAPAFSLPVVANGEGTLALASLKGHAVYLNFFASWCEPCKQEAPSIAKLSKQYRQRNVVVIGIDELEQAEAAKGFAAHYRLPYSITVDPSGEVGGTYGLVGIPLHVFIAPNGTVTAYREGELSEQQIRQELQSLSNAHR